MAPCSRHTTQHNACPIVDKAKLGTCNAHAASDIEMNIHWGWQVERDFWQLDGQCKCEELKRHCAVHAEWSSLSSLIYELLAS